MICPLCGHKGNLPGADWCVWCLFDLAAIDRPTPSDRVEQSLMGDPVTVLPPRPTTQVDEYATVGQAIQAMIHQQVGAVLVTSEAGTLIGILTERDCLTKVAGSRGVAALPVTAVMTRDPETVASTDTLAVVLGKMAGGGYRHLPVVVQGRPVGIISVRDVLTHIVRLCQDG